MWQCIIVFAHNTILTTKYKPLIQNVFASLSVHTLVRYKTTWKLWCAERKGNYSSGCNAGLSMGDPQVHDIILMACRLMWWWWPIVLRKWWGRVACDPSLGSTRTGPCSTLSDLHTTPADWLYWRMASWAQVDLKLAYQSGTLRQRIFTSTTTFQT